MYVKKVYFRFDAGQEVAIGLGNNQTTYRGGNLNSTAT